ncbi:MAG: metallophosphoesterase family protein [Elusimicrobia bacterium]|nr:metallophosphoesterase family protein [Elusimicrobiota bacterium]
MKFGVFSDVHSNLEALNAVLDFFKKNEITNYICCGDVVGYGPQPLECVRKVADLKNLTIVIGNHDAAVVGKMEMKWFNSQALEAIDFSRKNLSGELFRYLADLPEIIENQEFTIVHGSPKNHLKEYLLSESQFLENTGFWKISPCFIGHSHIPVYFKQNGIEIPESDFLKPLAKITANPAGKYMFNSGSVGQPRDGNPYASCAIYDSDKKAFEIFRIKYDVARTQKLMKEKKLPQVLIDRLSFGF